MNTMQASQVMNGTYGEIWIDGEYMAEVTAFEANVEFETADINQVRKLAKASKVVGISCSGQLTMNKVSSFFIKKLSDAVKQGKQVVCTIISKLNDPDSIGEERIVIKDATFNGLTLANWKAKTAGEEQVDFTFTDWDIQDMAIEE